MTDEELVKAFESTELPASAFPHAAHVRVAWWYLRSAPFHVALARFAAALQAFAAAKGASHKYHETITVAWMALVAERLARTPDLAWDGFAAAHPELFQRPSHVTQLYSEARLASDDARCTFVLPDLSGPTHATAP